jgi:TonB family protein
MFETSVVNARAIAAPRKAGVLTMSIAFHSFVAAAAVAMSIQTSSFPMNTPRQMEMLQEVLPVVLPPLPRGNSDAPRNPAPQPPPAQHVQTAPPQASQDVTPNQIPNDVPTVGTTDTAGQGNTDGRDTHGQWGVPDGDEHGVDIGQPLAQVSVPAPSGPLVAVGEVHAARVLSRVEPKYPGLALRGKIGGVVRLHCIIDRNGNLSDPEIVSSTFPPFNQPVLDAFRQWTFAPGTLHGQPVDTYFELTITFTPR